MGEAKRKRATGRVIPKPKMTVIDCFYLTSHYSRNNEPVPGTVHLVQSVWDFNHPERDPVIGILGPFETRAEAEDMERQFRAANTPEAIADLGLMIADSDVESGLREMAEAEARRMQQDAFSRHCANPTTLH